MQVSLGASLNLLEQETRLHMFHTEAEFKTLTRVNKSLSSISSIF